MNYLIKMKVIKSMITGNLVKRLWNEREEHICICRYLFNEKESKYLINVLNECGFDNFDSITTKTVCRETKEGYKKGKHYKTVAKELREQNRIIQGCM